MSSKPIYLATLLSATLLAGTLSCQSACATEAGEAAVKTAFLYNFFKFIQWPESVSNQAAFRLCTTGDDKLGDNLTVLENKTIANKPIEIFREQQGKELQRCHMVFIDSAENAGAVASAVKGLPIVTISDKADFIQHGGMIGLVSDGNRLAFEINLGAANANGVHINAQLIKLAKSIKNSQ